MAESTKLGPSDGFPVNASVCTAGADLMDNDTSMAEVDWIGEAP